MFFLDETKEQKYTWKDRKAGDEFYITVCAYRQSSGEQSHFAEPVHTFTRPEALTTFSIIKNASTSITLGWEKVESATGYLIYRTEANGVETKVGSTTTLEYKDTGLKSGVTYRYRIRTYFCRRGKHRRILGADFDHDESCQAVHEASCRKWPGKAHVDSGKWCDRIPHLSV